MTSVKTLKMKFNLEHGEKNSTEEEQTTLAVMPSSQTRARWRLRKASWASPSAFSLVSPSLVIILLCAYAPAPAQAAYGVCYDSMEEQYLSCMTSLTDAISTGRVQVTVDPESATCGNPPSTYRLMGTTTDRTCDASSATDSHPPSDMIDAERTDTWWQSINRSPGSTELLINVTLSFNKTYRLAGDILLTFAAGRPDKMVIEKSDDNGQTWAPLQYYARNCADFADVVDQDATITAENPTAVTCTNAYVETSSRATPGRRVVVANSDRFNLFLGQDASNFAAFYTALETKMLDFLIFTDLRFRFMKPANDGRSNFDAYYYAVSHVQVVARCYCNNHASECNYTATDVVCDCQHFTTGKDCESCLPLYNERPWQRGSFIPYDKGEPSVCVKCECNEHAESCHFNATYGRGQCDDCQHNTEGYHCERCMPLFYPNTSLQLSDSDRCVACDCETLGVLESNFECAQAAGPTVSVGQCSCKTQVTGRRCDSCTAGFWGLITGPTPGTCTACGCNLDGTQGQSNTCDQDTGQCPCKTSVNGTLCDTCADSYYSFPTGNPQRECLACNCDEGGATTATCNKDTGVCTCRTGITGDKCDRTVNGRFVPALDSLTLEPTEGPCSLTSGLYTTEAPFDGRVKAECDLGGGTLTLPLANIPGGMMQMAVDWTYYLAVRYTTNVTGITGTLFVTSAGNTAADLSPLSARLGQDVTAQCPPASGPAVQLPVTFSDDKSSAVLTAPNNVTLDARCQYTVTLQLSNTPATQSRRRRRRAIGDGPFITIDSVVPMPALANEDSSIAFNVLSAAEDPSQVSAQYADCLQRTASLTTRPLALRLSPCKDLLFSVSAELYDGTQDCSCDSVGTSPGAAASICQDLGGQCTCLPGVSGRTCDQCTPGYFNLTQTGCERCPTLPCPPERDDDDDHLAAGYVVLIVFACLLFLLGLVLLIICLSRWREKRAATRAKQERLNEYKLNDLSSVYRNGSSGGRKRREDDRGFPVKPDSDVPRLTDGSDVGSDDVFELSDTARRERQRQKAMFYITSDDSADSWERKRAADMQTFGSPYSASPVPGQENRRISLLTLAKLASKRKPIQPALPDSPMTRMRSDPLQESRDYTPYHSDNSSSYRRDPRRRAQSLDDHLIISDDSVDRMFPATSTPGGLHHWRAMPDLSIPLSTSDRSISPNARSSLSGASPDLSRYPQRRDVYPPRPLQTSVPKQVPPKPKRQKKAPAREPSFMNKIVPPPSLYSNTNNGILYIPEPDYDVMSDDSALLPFADHHSAFLRGVDNPIFIPDPDYPLYAGYESFDEVNGSLV